MSPARARKLLIAAVLLSVLLHLVLAGYLKWPFLTQSQDENRVAKVRITHISRIVSHTPPPPTPAPTPAAKPLVHASVAPPSLTKRGKGPTLTTTIPVRARTPAPPHPSLAPTPIALVTPSGPCGGHSNADPAVASTPDPVDITPEARAGKVSGTAAVRVSLDAQGRVVEAAVLQSSGNAGLDAAAVQMARGATYTPKYVACKAVAGDYTFTVRFVAW